MVALREPTTSKVSKGTAARAVIASRYPAVADTLKRPTDVYDWLERRGYVWRGGEWLLPIAHIGGTVVHATGAHGVVTRINGGTLTVRLKAGELETWSLLATLPTKLPPKEIQRMRTAVAVISQHRADIVRMCAAGDLLSQGVMDGLRAYAQSPNCETQRAVFDALLDWASASTGAKG